MARSPCSFYSLCSFYSPCWFPFTYWKPSLLWQDLVHLGLRLLVNWPPLSQLLPIPSPSQISSTQVNYAPHYDDFKIPASSVRNSSASPIIPDLPITWAVLTGKKGIINKIENNQQKSKNNVQTLGPRIYPVTGTNFDPPLFSLDTTFKLNYY